MLGRVINLTESLAPPLRLLIAAGLVLLAALAFLTPVAVIAQVAATGAPQNLQDTGLYADFKTLAVDPKHLAFTPQYPLWSDGAAKHRWLSLPAGGVIDGSDPDAWVFPIGTRFWKEFSFSGQRVETRYLERQADGQWLYAAYAWSPDGRAMLVSQKGRRNAYQLAAGRSYMIPGVNDCKACHEGGRSEILGFSTLQLSRDRDPDALHAEPRSFPDVDVNYLIEKGLLVGFPQALAKTPPRIEAASAIERAALGYMHANCGHCHNDQGSLKNLGLFLRHISADRPQPAAVTTTLGHPIKKSAPGQSPDAVLRVEARHPEGSALLERMASRYPALQMPPLGTELVDEDAVALIHRWISELEATRLEPKSQGKENLP